MPIFGLLRRSAAGSAKRSPPFEFINSGSITSTSNWVVDLTQDTTTIRGKQRRFTPFKNVSIQNNSDQSVRFLPNRNYDRHVNVLNRAMRELGDMDIINFEVELIGITEIGPNEITVTVWNE